nr:MAG TPA: hypothetical protein [Caudoviricetes sp.]
MAAIGPPIISTVITVCQDGSCERVVVVIAVATIDFFYSFSHNFEEFRNLLNNKVNYNISCKKLFSK